jgi:GT2 family glycosyltransferase
MNTLISIVFLNYNRLQETRITVEKLLKCRDKLNEIEIIAVDNDSTDGTREYLCQVGNNDMKTLLLDRNYGIEGYNKGFEISKGDVMIVLDDDSHVETDTIKRVKELFTNDKNLAIVAFKIIDGDGKRFNTWHIPSTDVFQESFAFVGCGFAIRKNVFKEIGFYPVDFFLYHNEIYVSMQTKLKGYKVVYDPQCVAVHRTTGQARDPSRRIYYSLRNSLILIWMYYPFFIAAYMIVSRIIISFSLAFFYSKVSVAAKALFDFISSKPKRIPLPKRERLLLKPFFFENSILHRVRFFLTKGVLKNKLMPNNQTISNKR